MFIERKECPVCKQNDGSKIFSLPYESIEMQNYIKQFYLSQGDIKDFSVFKDVEYELIHCENCDLIYQKFIPDNDLMFKLYEEYISPEIKKQEIFNGGRYKIDYFQNLSSEIEFLIKKSKIEPVKIKFLDFGMGWGFLCNMAMAYGCDAYGTELSPNRIEFAKNKGVKCLNYSEIKTSKFDIINLSDVLEHIDKPIELMEDLIKSLNTNGILRISVPYNKNILRNLSISNINLNTHQFNCVAPLEHINCFSQKTLKHIATKNKLTIEDYLDFTYRVNKNDSSLSKLKFFIKKKFLKWYYIKNSTNLVLQKK